MDQTLHDLGGIVLEGLPTFFLVLLLAVLVKYLYFRPLDKVLEERFRLTDGARQAAEDSLKNADAKISEYENSLSRARAEIYAEQARFLQSLQAEQAVKAQSIRIEAEQRVAAVKQSVAQQVNESRANLEAQSEALATQIADAVLQRRVV
jgi:F0F1-type ATP synthase membrane subunit b/b'